MPVLTSQILWNIPFSDPFSKLKHPHVPKSHPCKEIFLASSSLLSCVSPATFFGRPSSWVFCISTSLWAISSNSLCCLLMVTQNFPLFSLCPLPPILSLGTPEKSLAPLLHSFHQGGPLSLFSPRLKSPSSLSLPLHDRCCNPLIISLLFIPLKHLCVPCFTTVANSNFFLRFLFENLT